MYESEVKKVDENRYLRLFEEEFQKILAEVKAYSVIIPQYKNENESLRERISNIRGWAEAASKVRYMHGTDTDAVLANLITQILIETENINELKPLVQMSDEKTNTTDELFSLLAGSRSVDMDTAFEGFDFFDNNPYRRAADKKIQKIRKKQGYGS